MSLEINLNTNNPELNINSINANIKNDDENVEINLKTNSNILKNININKPKIQIGTPEINIGNDYNKAINKPSINNVELIGNKTTEDLGIVGSSMTEIEVSTDPENPTDISQYFNESGTYVAKNTGIIEVLGEIVTLIAKGGFFTIQNFKHDAGRFGIAVPDEANTLIVSLTVYNGEVAEEVRLKRLGADDWYVGVKITSDNASDYLDLDIDVTSEVQQALKTAVNNTYGMQLIGNYLSFVSATTNEIDSANTPYRVITPSNINYAIEKKGANYFASKTGFENLKTDISTLKAEIEIILESVVKVDE